MSESFDSPMSEASKDAYWSAVSNIDLQACESLLNKQPDLVHSRYQGIAWSADPVMGAGFTNTALHFAAVNSHLGLAELLIRFGADIDAIGYEENKGLTPSLVLAAWEGSTEMLKLLLDSGADSNLPASAESAIYCASEHDARDKVELLLSNGARVDIFTAAILGDAEKVKTMVTTYPPLMQARSLKRNRTVLEEAQHHGQNEVVKLLEILG